MKSIAKKIIQSQDELEQNPQLPHLSLTFRSPHIQLDSTQTIATGYKGFTTILAHYPIYEGIFFCEFTILKPKEPLPFKNVQPHVRIGIADSKMNCELPLGSHELSYCYRDVDGSIYYNGEKLCATEPFEEGDTIGMLVKMGPPKPPRRKRKIRENKAN